MDSYPSSSSSSSFESSPLSAVQNVASGICNFVSTSVNGKPLEGEPSKVLWHSLEEYEMDGIPQLFLVLGLPYGFQVYHFAGPSDIRKVAESSEGPSGSVACIKFLLTSSKQTTFTEKAGPTEVNNQELGPLLALTSGADRKGFSRAVVKIFSLKTQSYLHVLRLPSAVHALQSHHNILVVMLERELHAFRITLRFRPPPPSSSSSSSPAPAPAAFVDFEPLFNTPCFPNPPNYGICALGPRWLAYPAADPPPTGGMPPSPLLQPSSLPPSPQLSPALPALRGRQGSNPPTLRLGSSPEPASAAAVVTSLASGILALGDKGKKTLRTLAQLAGSDEAGPGAAGEGAVGAVGGRANGRQSGGAATARGSVVVRDVLRGQRGGGQPLSHFTAHASAAVTCLTMDRPGGLLVTAPEGGRILHVYRLRAPPQQQRGQQGRDPQLLYRLHRGVSPGHVRCCFFSRDSSLVGIATTRTLHVFSMKTLHDRPSLRHVPTAQPSSSGGAGGEGGGGGVHRTVDSVLRLPLRPRDWTGGARELLVGTGPAAEADALASRMLVPANPANGNRVVACFADALPCPPPAPDAGAEEAGREEQGADSDSGSPLRTNLLITTGYNVLRAIKVCELREKEWAAAEGQSIWELTPHISLQAFHSSSPSSTSSSSSSSPPPASLRPPIAPTPLSPANQADSSSPPFSAPLSSLSERPRGVAPPPAQPDTGVQVGSLFQDWAGPAAAALHRTRAAALTGIFRGHCLPASRPAAGQATTQPLPEAPMAGAMSKERQLAWLQQAELTTFHTQHIQSPWASPQFQIACYEPPAGAISFAKAKTKAKNSGKRNQNSAEAAKQAKQAAGDAQCVAFDSLFCEEAEAEAFTFEKFQSFEGITVLTSSAPPGSPAPINSPSANLSLSGTFSVPLDDESKGTLKDQLALALGQDLQQGIERRRVGRRTLVDDDEEGISAVGDGQGGTGLKIQLKVNENSQHFASRAQQPEASTAAQTV